MLPSINALLGLISTSFSKTIRTIRCECLSQVDYPDGMYPISGGTVSGSGGNAQLEDAPPAYAFDGNDQNRWVDINGGGIGNTSWLGYEHLEPVAVSEYSITSQMYALSSYHSHLNGAPRDWTLQVLSEETGLWEVVDKRSHVYFSGHRQTHKFQVAKPMVARKYKLEFTAVAAGCASRSIQASGVCLRIAFLGRCGLRKAM